MLRKASLFAKRYKQELALAAQALLSVGALVAIRSLLSTVEIQQQEIDILKMEVDDLNTQTETIDIRLEMMED